MDGTQMYCMASLSTSSATSDVTRSEHFYADAGQAYDLIDRFRFSCPSNVSVAACHVCGQHTMFVPAIGTV